MLGTQLTLEAVASRSRSKGAGVGVWGLLFVRTSFQALMDFLMMCVYFLDKVKSRGKGKLAWALVHYLTSELDFRKWISSTQAAPGDGSS